MRKGTKKYRTKIKGGTSRSISRSTRSTRNIFKNYLKRPTTIKSVASRRKSLRKSLSLNTKSLESKYNAHRKRIASAVTQSSAK
jgi:hypothetical protein